MIFSVTIPDWRPARINSLVGVHWAVAAKRKKLDRNLLSVYFQGKPKATTKRRVRLHIILTGRQKEADPDAQYKSLLDGLVKCGMLVDDSNQWCEITTPTYDRALQGSTTIMLEDV